MLKRTKSIFLLMLLVVTGMASRVANTTLTSAERKYAVTHLKESRDAFLQSVKGLSAAQLAFTPSAEQWSVQECITHITLSEEELWNLTAKTLQQPANPEKRADIKTADADLVKMMSSREQKVKTYAQLQPDKAKWADVESTLKHFKAQRKEHIQYLKNSTDDFRNHVAQLPFGTMDAYQLVLLLSAHTQRHTAQINELKAHPQFPKL